MDIAVKKWGNSYAIRIPKDIVQALEIKTETLLEMTVEKGKVIMQPKKQSDLESLVSQISQNNLHSSIDTGERVGNEEW